MNVKTLADGIAPVLVEAIDHYAVKPLSARIEALEKALEAQKAAPLSLSDSFRGTWMPGTTFSRGSLVVWDGSLWLALVDSAEKPGASSDFKMVCKKGRDGKDFRP
jgi:hypothetical protein